MLLPSDAYREDAEIVQRGLLPDEQAWFEDKRMLLDPTNARPAVDIVADHTVDVPLERWAQYSQLLGSHTAFAAGALSRGELFALAQHCLAQSSRWSDLLGASFAWGYGRNALGPARLKRILYGHNGTPAPEPQEVQKRLASAVDALQAQDALAAYTLLRDDQPLAHWGPAFFTKFLYFVMYEKRWATYRWSPYRYQVYLTFLRVAADQLAGTAQTRWSPGLVERVLYQFDL